MTNPASAEPFGSEWRTRIQRRVKIRFTFSILVFALYAGFAGGYGFLKSLFQQSVFGDSGLSFGLAYFFSLVILFISLEFVYLKLVAKANDTKGSLKPARHITRNRKSTDKKPGNLHHADS